MADWRHPTGRCDDPAAIIACNAACGLSPIAAIDVAAARAAAARRLEGIASAETFSAVQEITGASLFQYRTPDGAAEGLLAMFSVRAAALPLLKTGAFDGVAIDLDLVARPGEIPSAWYGWGFAAMTRRAGAAVIKAACAVQQRLFWAIPAYSRTASPDGIRVVAGRMGYQPSGGVDPTMVWIPPHVAGATL